MRDLNGQLAPIDFPRKREAPLQWWSITSPPAGATSPGCFKRDYYRQAASSNNIQQSDDTTRCFTWQGRAEDCPFHLPNDILRLVVMRYGWFINDSNANESMNLFQKTIKVLRRSRSLNSEQTKNKHISGANRTPSEATTKAKGSLNNIREYCESRSSEIRC